MLLKLKIFKCSSKVKIIIYIRRKYNKDEFTLALFEYKYNIFGSEPQTGNSHDVK